MRARIAPTVLLAYLAFVLVGIGAGISGVLLLAQIEDYGVDRASIGIVFFTGSAGFVLAGSTAGALIERVGFRVALAAGAGAFVLAGLYLASRPPFAVFVAVQAVTGYATGVLESVLNAYLAARPDPTTLLNRLHAFFGVGALIGPVLASWIVARTEWTVVWLVVALAAVPLAVGFLVAYPKHAGVPEQPAAPRQAASPKQSADPKPVASGGLFRAALREPGVLLGTALLAVYVGLEIGVGNWGFSYLVQARGQHELVAGYVVSGYWAGLTLGRFLLSPAATRVGMSVVGLMSSCLVGVTAATALTWLVPGAAAASAGLVLLGFFLGPVFPTTMAVAPRLTTDRLVPTAIGVMNAGSVVGGAALPWLAGALAQGAGAATLLPYTLALAILQLLVWWPVAARLRTPSPAPASS